jgi:2-polyprenyl-6-methoxyphenol hydroxylase-like FAD-dependent oxidoreductase
MRVVTVGGGPAGLFFALLLKLREPAIDVELIERNPAGVAHGWGVVLWQDGLDAVLAADHVTGSALDEALYQWQGVRVDLFGDEHLDAEATGRSISRRNLLALLAGRAEQVGVQLHFGREVDPTNPPPADLVVACDGAGSRLRRSHSAEFGTKVKASANRYVWLGVDRRFDSFTFAFVASAAGPLWCHAYAHSEQQSTFIIECQASTWERLGLGALDLEEGLSLLQRLFARQLGDASLLAPAGWRDALPWQTFSTVTNRVWHLDNLAIVGDAAHTTHFSIGSGTKLALQDAIALADELHSRQTLGEALAGYQSNRRRATELAQRDARHSLNWFQDVPRYIDRPVSQFVELMHARRSSLQAHLPPAAYLGIRHLADTRPALRRSWDRLLHR